MGILRRCYCPICHVHQPYDPNTKNWIEIEIEHREHIIGAAK